MAAGIAVLAAVLAVFFFGPHFGYVRYQSPDFLTFAELRKLNEPQPGYRLKKKLEKFWKTPLISNEAWFAGERPVKQKDPKLGPVLRLASWNIEKSINMKEAVTAFTDEAAFKTLIDEGEAGEGSEKRTEILRQRARLAAADIIFLQEMDIGVKRSGYINAAEDLAKAMRMNYTYAAEQLEIDPAYLGMEKILLEDGKEDTEAMEHYAGDPKLYKGVFGCALLSRYPIKHVEVFQLQNQAYDWFKGEKPYPTFLEKTRRFGAKTVFRNEITREIKRGGRIFFRVDLDVPGLPHNTLTIINIHLEIKCKPEGRERQMQEILSHIQKIRNPVIVAGDFNSAPEDLSPTSVTRAAGNIAKSPETWLSVGTSVLLPHALLINATRVTTKLTKNFQDPLASDIAVVSPNPLKPLFSMIQNFRFSDGASFDFRGDEKRSINGKDKALANSNERDFKGFKTSFKVRRPIGPVIGKHRLDWFFVKSGYVKDPYNPNAPYKLAPHFGETLEEMNTSLKEQISDHHPNVLDIPLTEVKL